MSPPVPGAARRARWLRRGLIAVAILSAIGATTVACVRPLSAKGGLPLSAAGAFGGGRLATVVTPAGHVAPPSGWSVERTSKAGAPLIATKLVYPDPADRGAFAAAGWLSTTGLRFTLVPGTTQPGGTWATHGAVPADQLGGLAAVFNSGFKYKDLTGGFRAQGRTVVPLRVGDASLAFTADGRVTIGAWGRDLADRGDLVAVRQNLKLIVTHGHAVGGLLTRHDGSWSTEHRQVQQTPRSGIGQLADGSLVYVAGPNLDLQQLADALVAVHAVTAMQLDIHPNMIVFHIFDPGSGSSAGRARELLDVMTAPLDRYLVADGRDFITATER